MELLELARPEVAAVRHELGADLADERGLSYARCADDGHGPAALGAGLGQGPPDRLALVVPAVQAGRHAELPGRRLGGGLERIDAPLALPLAAAALQVGLQGGHRLVAVLGHLGEQLHDQVAERARQARLQLVERQRARGHRVMEDLQHVPAHDGRPTSQQPIEHRAEGVAVGPSVDGPVHAARLLGGAEAGGAFDEAGAGVGHGPPGQPGREAEVDDPHRPRAGVQDDVVGRQVPVDDARPVQPLHRPGQATGEPDELVDAHPLPLVQARQRLAADVLHLEGQAEPPRHDLPHAHDVLHVQVA